MSSAQSIPPPAPVWRFARVGDESLHVLAPPRWRDKARRLSSHVAQIRELAAGGLLFSLLRPFLPDGLSPDDLAFRENDFGKPLLRDFPSIHVSISHSGDWVMAAASPRPVGCDVQRLGPLPLPLARRVFTPREFAHLLALPDLPHRPREFFRVWTLKEAFLKAIGTGFFRSPASVDSALVPASTVPPPPSCAAAISSP